MSLKSFKIVFLFQLIIFLKFTVQINGFTNILGEFFNDLRFGSIDKDYLSQKFSSTKLKCLQGSHPFNGSCYFISNKKYLDPETEKDIIIEHFLKMYKKGKQLSSLQSAQLGTASELTSLQVDASWEKSASLCTQLNNDSTLLTFSSNPAEYDYMIQLLKKLNFPDNLNNNNNDDNDKFEQKYFIGLIYNNSAWKWINGMNISEIIRQKMSLNTVNTFDKIRKCAYLNIRDDGAKIEMSNCHNEKQPYICKYVIDRCYNNTSCGPNGECVNVFYKKSFECRCRIFYDGEKCEKWSNQGIQMIIALNMVIFAFIFVFVINISNKIKHKLINRNQRIKRDQDNYNRYVLEYNGTATNSLLKEKSNTFSIQKLEFNLCKLVLIFIRKQLKLFLLLMFSFIISIALILCITFVRYKIIEIRIKRFKSGIQKESDKSIEDIDKDSTSYLTTFFSVDLCKIMNDQFLEDYILIFISMSLTVLIYFWNAFKCNRNHEYFCQYSKFKVRNCNSSTKTVDDSSESMNETNNNDLIKNENEDETVRCKNLRPLFSFWSFISKRINTKKIRQFTLCGFKCTCGVEFPIPINPFSKKNRFLTAVIYAAYTYNILKIFEYLLIGDQNLQTIEQGKNIVKNISLSNITFPKNFSLQNANQRFISTFQNATESFTRMAERGILMDLLKQICNVFIIGLRYYPVLLCVELKRKSKFCYFICTLYVSFLLIYYVYMNTFCLLSAYTTIKDAYKTMYSNQKPPLELTNSVGLDSIQSNPRMLYVHSKGNSINYTKSHILFGLTTRQTFFKNKTRFLRQYYYDNQFENYQKNNPFKVDDKIENLLNTTDNSLNDMKNNFTDSLFAMNGSVFLNNFMYEKFLFYTVLCLITFNMITEFALLIIKSIRRKRIKKERKRKRCFCCQKKLEAENKQETDEETDSNEDENEYSFGKHEIYYTKHLLEQQIQKPTSFMKFFFEKYIYHKKKDFRFSKQFINTNIIAFILLYYITCIIIRKSKLIVSLSSNVLILMINFVFKMSSATDNGFMIVSKSSINNLILSLYDNISTYIIIACCFTTAIYVIQLFLGIKNYQRHIINGYKGVYVDIPSPKRFSNAKLASSSLHYSGYAVGYLLWGYLILFEVSLVIIIVVRFLIKFYFIAENLAKIVLPLVTIYLFKRILIWYLCRYFLTNNSKSQQKFSLKNRKFYFILNHFNFFFDCFLGSFVCFMRMAKSSMAALFFMPRLDYSIFGRFLESKDMGFISYVTFIHMEVNQTHPVKLAFCEVIKKSQFECCENEKYRKLYRNKWFVAYTLIKNASLKKYRKRYLYLNNLIPRVESFEQFLERHVKTKFFNDNIKKKASLHRAC